MTKTKKTDQEFRCLWVGNDDLLKQYHDEQWGVPVHDDREHFEMLTLEGAQAGLNWLTILKKRENYRRIFNNFDPKKIAKMQDRDLEQCLQDEGIIRNRLKVFSVRKNAVAFLNIQAEFGSFDDYIWRHVNHMQIVNKHRRMTDIPAQTDLSILISKDLKKRGMSFVGPTIIYAYMQAVSLVNDHLMDCWRYHDCIEHSV